MSVQHHTNEVDFDDAQVDKLVKLLKKVEDADNAKKAIWLPEGDRQAIAEIRAEIEEQTGR